MDEVHNWWTKSTTNRLNGSWLTLIDPRSGNNKTYIKGAKQKICLRLSRPKAGAPQLGCGYAALGIPKAGLWDQAPKAALRAAKENALRAAKENALRAAKKNALRAAKENALRAFV